MGKVTSIVKYPGGKAKELKKLEGLLPSDIRRCIDPFVGGGSVLCGIEAGSYLVNDKSEDLMLLYRCVKSADESFFALVSLVGSAWRKIGELAYGDDVLFDLYKRHLAGELDEAGLEAGVMAHLDQSADAYDDAVMEFAGERGRGFSKGLLFPVLRKMHRMVVLDHTKRHLPDEDIRDNIESVVKAGFYTVLRSMYNDGPESCSKAFRAMAYLFIRDFCYSSMFRFSSAGDFNVPYGGISYNGKDFGHHVEEYMDPDLRDRLSRTECSCLDYREFLDGIDMAEGDFMFVDPPYDSAFSSYDGNSFDASEQEALAEVLKRCECDFMMVVRRTPLLDGLYRDGELLDNGRTLRVAYFDKKYSVSFMNRNEKDFEHMVVMNYGA